MARTWPFNAANYLAFNVGTHNTTLDGIGSNNNPLALSFWFKINGHLGTEQTLLARYPDPTFNSGVLVRINAARHIGFFWVDGSLQGHEAIGATTLTTGVWHHCLCVYRTNPSSLGTVYLDGVQDASAAGGLSLHSSPNVTQWRLGERCNGLLPFDGVLAELAMFAVELTAPEAAALGKGAPPALVAHGLEGYWPTFGSFDQGVYLWGVDQDISRLALTGTLATADHAPCGRQVPFPG